MGSRAGGRVGLDPPQRQDLHPRRHSGQAHLLRRAGGPGRSAESPDGRGVGRAQPRVHRGWQDGQAARRVHAERPVLGHFLAAAGHRVGAEAGHLRGGLAGPVPEREGPGGDHDVWGHTGVRPVLQLLKALSYLCVLHVGITVCP